VQLHLSRLLNQNKPVRRHRSKNRNEMLFGSPPCLETLPCRLMVFGEALVRDLARRNMLSPEENASAA
jgi:hypothetical protein